MKLLDTNEGTCINVDLVTYVRRNLYSGRAEVHFAGGDYIQLAADYDDFMDKFGEELWIS